MEVLDARLVTAEHEILAVHGLQAALDADPDVVRKVIADMRTLLDAIEHDVSAQPVDAGTSR